jgi:hypothetical protein
MGPLDFSGSTKHFGFCPKTTVEIFMKLGRDASSRQWKELQCLVNEL